MAKGRGSYIRKKDLEHLKTIKNCLYCGSDSNLYNDHILPPSRGGNSDLSNLTRCCNICNSSKSDSTIDEWKTRLEKRKEKAFKEFTYCEEVLSSIETEYYFLI